MAKKYNAQNDHYIRRPERETIRKHMRTEKISVSQMAYDLRLDRSYLSGMFNGHFKMARYHLLAMQFVLLKARVARQAAERVGLTGGLNTAETEPHQPLTPEKTI